MGSVIIIAILTVVIAIWWGAAYRNLIELETQAEQALGTLAAQLQQRIDLIPDILKAAREAVNFQMIHLNQILEVRKEIHSIHKRSGVKEADMPDELRVLNNLAHDTSLNQPIYEDNPEIDIKTYNKLQDIIIDTEKDIAAARRFVEDAKAQYNAAIRFFPGSLVASVYGFSKLPNTKIDSKLDSKPDYWKY